MKLTILFDLDGTLLLNQVEVFLPAYLDLLSHHLVSWPADQVVKHLLAATNRMVKEPASGRTLEEIFDGHFFPALGTTRAALQPEIDFFYEYVYPGLREHTRPQPGAKELIDLLVRKGHDLVIATNPVFPATAIHQRLEWAGFQPDQNPFKLISNFSDFHFSKPHPAFFAEILARLGWVDQPAVMIGDSLTEDIIPAAALGLPVYWINTEGSLPENLHSLSRSGSFAGILDWIESVEQSLIETKLDSRQAVEAVLKATPAVLDYLIRSLPESRWKSRPGPDEWCLTEIICHLRDVDLEVNLPRIELIS